MQLNYNKDIMDWEQFPPHDILWCDPPWEQRMVKFFESKMEKGGHGRPENTIEAILHKLGSLANPKKLLVIEYSIKGSELVMEIMKQHGHELYCYRDPIQTSGHPYRIMIFNQAIVINDKLKGFNLVKDALKNAPKDKVVFDPFAGIGASAKAFRSIGLTYIGSEINPDRYERLCKINI